jgi:hypothetical protein
VYACFNVHSPSMLRKKVCHGTSLHVSPKLYDTMSSTLRNTISYYFCAQQKFSFQIQENQNTNFRRALTCPASTTLVERMAVTSATSDEEGKGTRQSNIKPASTWWRQQRGRWRWRQGRRWQGLRGHGDSSDGGDDDAKRQQRQRGWHLPPSTRRLDIIHRSKSAGKRNRQLISQGGPGHLNSRGSRAAPTRGVPGNTAGIGTVETAAVSIAEGGGCFILCFVVRD